MVASTHSGFDHTLYPAGAPAIVGSAVSWSAIIAGTVAAIALTLTLVTLGSAFGLASISAWPGVGAKASNFTIGAGLWLIVTQWLSSAFGGYLSGRMRTRWHGLHTDEVFFRDTAHGFMTWALSTVIVAIVTAAAVSISSLAAAHIDVPVTAEAAETARKSAAAFATFTGLALVIGAFVGSVGGAIGGKLREMHP